jgi:hypothetical protein
MPQQVGELCTAAGRAGGATEKVEGARLSRRPQDVPGPENPSYFFFFATFFFVAFFFAAFFLAAM